MTVNVEPDLLQFKNQTDQSEREEFNLWLKIKNLIGHHEF